MDSRALKQDIAAYIAGDTGAGDRICRHLETPVRNEVRRFLSVADIDYDDIVQDSLIAMLSYLRKSQRCPERPEAFVVTITGNRCRNLYHWRKRRPSMEIEKASTFLVDAGDDPLEQLDGRELESLLGDAFDRLDPDCRRLLLSIYLEKSHMEELQQDAGLRTIQGVYYRKYVCLKKLGKLLNRSWFSGR